MDTKAVSPKGKKKAMNTNYENEIANTLDDLDRMMFGDSDDAFEAFGQARGRLLSMAKRIRLIEAEPPSGPLLPKVKPISKPKMKRKQRTGPIEELRGTPLAVMMEADCPACDMPAGDRCVHLKDTNHGKKGEITRTLHRERTDAWRL